VGAAGETLEERPRLALRLWLSENLTVEEDLRVAAEHVVPVDRARLAAGVLYDYLTRLAGAQLLDLRRLRPEIDPELLEDRAALRGGRGED
jgi:hypothetical protein